MAIHVSELRRRFYSGAPKGGSHRYDESATGGDAAAIIHDQTMELPAQDATQDDAESVYSVDEAGDSDAEESRYA